MRLTEKVSQLVKGRIVEPLEVCMFAMLLPLVASAGKLPTVKTTSGTLQGVSSAYAEQIMVFRGVRFAEPPIGNLRFKPPVPYRRRPGIVPANEAGAACWQPHVPITNLYSRGNIERSEDCLFLNVFTPSAKYDEPLPVMVWFHGGGNRAGFDGTSLARKGVIVVTANYRLGALGLFAHPSLTGESPHHSSGNYTLLDQLEALRWVQKNIVNFGGDPDRVTIFGQSAGALDVCALMASPLGKGLFHGVIGESGGCLRTNTQLEGEKGAAQMGEATASRLGISGDDDEVLGKLRSLQPDEINQAFAESPHGLIVDGWVLPEPPGITFANGRQNLVPVMVGGAANEMQGLMSGAKEVSRAVFSKSISDNFGPDAARIEKYYRNTIARSTREAQWEILTDASFLWQSRAWARDVRRSGQPAFVYHFVQIPPAFHLYLPEQPDMKLEAGLRSMGAYHSGELAYVFGNLGLVGMGWDESDRELSRIMVDYWVNFARSGNPNGAGLPSWPVYDPDSDRVQILDGKAVSSSVHPRANSLNLFDEIFKQNH